MRSQLVEFVVRIVRDYVMMVHAKRGRGVQETESRRGRVRLLSQGLPWPFAFSVGCLREVVCACRVECMGPRACRWCCGRERERTSGEPRQRRRSAYADVCDMVVHTAVQPYVWTMVSCTVEDRTQETRAAPRSFTSAVCALVKGTSKGT